MTTTILGRHEGEMGRGRVAVSAQKQLDGKVRILREIAIWTGPPESPRCVLVCDDLTLEQEEAVWLRDLLAREYGAGEVRP